MGSLPLLAALALASAPPAAIDHFPWAAEGQLDPSDPIDPGYNHPYDDYPLLLTAGTRYRIAVEAPDGASALMVQLMRPGEEENPIADDLGLGEDSANARITFGPQTSGVYVVRVSGIIERRDGGARLPYSVRVTLLPADAIAAAPAPDATRPALWRIWEGALAADDPDDISGRHFDEYRLRLTAGQSRMVVVEQLSPGPAGDHFEGHMGLQVSVDGGGDQDEVIFGLGEGGPANAAALGVRAERTGDYVVRIMASEPGWTGGYRLRIGE